MKKLSKNLTVEDIAIIADSGADVSKYFSNKGKIKLPTQRVNVDFTVDMLNELDTVAQELNVSRQAVIKVYLRQALDQHLIARKTVS